MRNVRAIVLPATSRLSNSLLVSTVRDVIGQRLLFDRLGGRVFAARQWMDVCGVRTQGHAIVETARRSGRLPGR